MAEDDDEPPVCPACGQEVAEDAPEVEAIRATVRDLEQRLAGLRASEPASGHIRTELERVLNTARDELQQVTATIAAATRADVELSRSGELAQQSAHVRGRIHEFLAGLPGSDDNLAAREREVSRLSAEVERLDEQLNPSSFRERTESLLRVISADMSGWARELGLYYSAHGGQIDATDLTVVADTRDGPVPLSRMGSAANIIGYHVTAHLALHKWSVERGRPMPAFPMLDQPSQAFYPDDVVRQEDEQISDEDRERVTALYALLHGVVSDLEGRLQVIVLDHANLNVPWFQEAVVANWRFGGALVPESWLEDANG